MSCPECVSGFVHSGTPTGQVTTIHGRKTYVASPPEGVTPKAIIVMISDGFGWGFINNRLLADTYAAKGNFLVYLPDFMNGSALHPSILDLIENKIMKPGSWFNAIFFKPFYVIRAMIQAVPWIIRNRPAATKPGVFKFMTALRTFPPPFPTNDLKIGAAGFCWGGYFTIQLAHNTPSARVIRHESQLNSSTIQPLIDCGYTAHPSNVKVPSDIEPVELPLSVIVGDIDIQMKGPLGVKTKEILEGKSKDNEVVIIPGAKHGFSIRTDPNDKEQMEFADQAEAQALAWFEKWLA